ncbi:MAG: cache domain-containing protein [Firmicutes bacterium]|jgi:diguanylate cyclase (GGDEF)-like protein|nr:cache domain-containing protein [Bacillota bacterium]
MLNHGKKQNNKVTNTSSITLIIFMIVTSAILIQGIIWLVDSIYLFKSDIEEVSQIQTDYIKAELRERVSSVLDYSVYKSQEIEMVLKDNLKSRTYEAHGIMTSIYQNNKNNKSKEEIKKMIKDALRDIRFNDGRGYFFVDTLEGDVILYPVYPESEDSNIINLQDENGDYVVKEEINLVKSIGEGYIEGYWKTPNSSNDEKHRKITFVKAFEPYGWYIGCGDYVDEITKEIQNEVIDYVNSIKYSENNSQYVFIHDYEGWELANGMYPEYIATNNYELEDINGAKVLQEQIDICIESNGGYLTHYWPTVDGKSNYKKLTYVAPLPKWEWVIGTGMDISEIDAMIASKEKELESFIWHRILLILIILAALVMISMIQIKSFMKKIDKNFSVFRDYMISAEESLEPIDVEDLDYTAFSELAEVTNSMTERINQLLNYDELTGIYNRRYFKDEFQKAIIKYPDETGIVVMDIDHFKKVNDQYGHDIGDHTLMIVAKLIEENTPNNGFVARFGGEEFIVFLTDVTKEDAIEVAENIRKKIENKYIEAISGNVTISCGVAHSMDNEGHELFKEADNKLYIAKESGRNRTEY